MLKVKTKSNPDLKMFVEKTKFKFEVALIYFNTTFWNIPSNLEEFLCYLLYFRKFQCVYMRVC